MNIVLQYPGSNNYDVLFRWGYGYKEIYSDTSTEHCVAGND
jgi:hypothetical protein